MTTTDEWTLVVLISSGEGGEHLQILSKPFNNPDAASFAKSNLHNRLTYSAIMDTRTMDSFIVGPEGRVA